MDYKIEVVVDNLVVKSKIDVASGKLAEAVKGLTLWAQSQKIVYFNIKIGRD